MKIGDKVIDVVMDGPLSERVFKITQLDEDAAFIEDKYQALWVNRNRLRLVSRMWDELVSRVWDEPDARYMCLVKGKGEPTVEHTLEEAKAEGARLARKMGLEVIVLKIAGKMVPKEQPVEWEAAG